MKNLKKFKTNPLALNHHKKDSKELRLNQCLQKQDRIYGLNLNRNKNSNNPQRMLKRPTIYTNNIHNLENKNPKLCSIQRTRKMQAILKGQMINRCQFHDDADDGTIQVFKAAITTTLHERKTHLK